MWLGMVTISEKRFPEIKCILNMNILKTGIARKALVLAFIFMPFFVRGAGLKI